MRGIMLVGLFAVGVSFAATDARAWFCTAESKNGAVGTGFHFFQVESEKAALKECRAHSKGKVCRITSCW